MNDNRLNRRQFIEQTALAAGAFALAYRAVPAARAAAATAAVKRTAVDQVTLGKAGLKLSRLGFGLGSDSGAIQVAAGDDAFNKLVHYAFDQGITYFDTARSYRTFDKLGAAIKGLPREKLFIVSKMPDLPADVLAVVDAHRKAFNTDYVDCMMVHCMFKAGWMDEWKRGLDALSQAKDKKWIKSLGVSCHSLPALRAAIASDWPEVHLVRVNPQGVRIDAMEEVMWHFTDSPSFDIAPVLAELKKMKAKNRGVIGMKIMGNGEFTNDADREKSVRFAMAQPELDSVVIGFKSTDEIDKAIKLINTALAEAA